MPDERIPERTTRRLSLYLRLLADLDAEGTKTVSSRQIAERSQLKPAQVRKDLAYFGAFGVRGVGYRVAELRRIIEGILGLDRNLRAVIVGAGNLGTALGDYPGFSGPGFEIVALFDVSPDKIGTHTRSGRPVYPMDRLESVVQAAGVEIGIVCVPAVHAQSVVDRLARAGVRGVLNFAPVRPSAPAGIHLRNVDLKVELESLSFYLAGAGHTPGTEPTPPRQRHA